MYVYHDQCYLSIYTQTFDRKCIADYQYRPRKKEKEGCIATLSIGKCIKWETHKTHVAFPAATDDNIERTCNVFTDLGKRQHFCSFTPSAETIFYLNFCA